MEETYDERWLNTDTEWKHPAPVPFRTAKQYCDPRRGHMFMLIGERRQRFYNHADERDALVGDWFADVLA